MVRIQDIYTIQYGYGNMTNLKKHDPGYGDTRTQICVFMHVIYKVHPKSRNC